jgi:hypothetical protein
MECAKPQKEHEWLQQLVGEWTYESEMNCGPDQPPLKTVGKEVVRPLGAPGGFWVLCEGSGDCPGMGMAFVQFCFGYDPAKQRFVGTFIGTMMPQLWIYDGELDAAARVLTLHTEGPSFTQEGKLAKYKDVIEIKGPDHRVLTSHALVEDGKWTQFMESHYRRRA